MLRRRTFLKLGAAAMAASARSAIAAPAPYPARPIYLIVGFSAGGNTDILARLIGEWLTRQMGEPFIVENRTGAATNIATEQVVRAPADGYTLLVSSTSNAINASDRPNTMELGRCPEYLEEKPPPSDPAHLADAQVLYFGSSNDEHVWVLEQENNEVNVELRPSLCCDDMATLKEAAIGGGGIVGLPTYIVDSAIKQRQLLPILQGCD
jgi:DNA-binding transcriptional LysR family regulator